MAKQFASKVLVAAALAGSALIVSGAAPHTVDPGVIVHEWGTFTSIAGPEGNALAWTPLDGPSELPCFVTMLNPTSVKRLITAANPLGGDGPGSTAVEQIDNGEGGLPLIAGVQATVRMETPVLYFYATREQSVQVHVNFPHGLITEWYPAALVPPVGFPAGVNVTLDHRGDTTAIDVGPQSNIAAHTGSIDWTDVKIQPTTHPAYPTEPGASHYYAARETDASPIQVGEQHEKFLFYRGLATFAVPIAARFDGRGAIVVSPMGADTVGTVILFKKEGGTIGYRVVDHLGAGATIEVPALTSTFASLRTALESLLVARGLYPREAAAMVETWRDSWFEDGTRLFYLMPRSSVDARLPLEIAPTPTATARVFVGRLEMITRDQVRDVSNEIAANDILALAHRGRFLEPISRGITIDANAGLSEQRIDKALAAAALANAKNAHRCDGQ